jgi:hypothetical protein
MKAMLVFLITLSRQMRIGGTSKRFASGWRSAKPHLCLQLPSLTRSGEERSSWMTTTGGTDVTLDDALGVARL